MEIQGFDLIGFDLFGIDLNTIDINTDNSIDVKESYIPTTQSPYIKGHITTSDNTFTFKVNNTSTSVSVNANGDFKYKPTATITQLDFVGVPELESLELYKINGVTTFNVDYPTKVTFKKCDNTTQNAKVDVYHIRGTATDNFQFTLKYIDDNNTVTTVTESAVIDGNGKWDISYSGKNIYSMTTFFDTNWGGRRIKTWEFTEKLDKITTFNDTEINAQARYRGLFMELSNLISVKFAKGTTLKSLIYSNGMFHSCAKLEEIINTEQITLENVSLLSGFIERCNTITSLDLSSIVTQVADSSLRDAPSLIDLYVPQTSIQNRNIEFSNTPISYDSMLRVAGWLKDLTGLTTHTVTFKKATYDALTEEQKATLEGIIVTQKHWNLATV